MSIALNSFFFSESYIVPLPLLVYPARPPSGLYLYLMKTVSPAIACLLLLAPFRLAASPDVSEAVKTDRPSTAAKVADDILDLAGEWKFALDPRNVGIAEKWHLREFDEVVKLPGSLAENKKGRHVNPNAELYRLSVEYDYRGVAWYRKSIVVPEGWEGLPAEFSIERGKVSKAWLDDVFLGGSDALGVPQRYRINRLAAGRHTLTVMVDNRARPAGNIAGHMITDQVQSEWNGLLGEIRLRALREVRLDGISIRPDVANRTARITLEVGNDGKAARDVLLSLKARPFNVPRARGMSESAVVKRVGIPAGGGSVTVDLPLGADALLWDEFEPALYRLNVVMTPEGGGASEVRDTEFGLREFKRNGTQFAVNGNTVMLRGKHDAMAFPLTGYAPTGFNDWLRVLTIAKSYGINHYRFHTCTPPDAAFLAADRVGIYMQPELYNNQGEYAEGPAAAYNLAEGRRILKEYGHHPSFVMMALGNEMGGGRALRARHVAEFRTYDPTRLYAQGTNNEWWSPVFADGDAYWTTVRTARKSADHAVRGSFAHVDNPLGHIQVGRPSTERDYSFALKGIAAPVIGQETGQFEIFPSYREISKYTGVQKPWNLMAFRQRLEKAGMSDQADAFSAASGALALRGYREEIEAALRTPGLGGFQLLDLQDYPGQGTALVGILDAFMDSKGLVTPEEWRRFCGPVVPLARFKSYTWTSSQHFSARVQLAQYGPKALPALPLVWRLTDARGTELKKGTLTAPGYPQGSLVDVGVLDFALADLPVPARYDLELRVEGAGARNTYPLWIYADKVQTAVPAGVKIATQWDAATKALLEAGSTVLLMPDPEGMKGIKGFFMTDFWSFKMFGNMSKNKEWKQPGTMGVLVDPAHPALRNFPTETHSDWQWFDLVMGSRSMILNGTPKGFRPIVQVIDNLDRNHKLGALFEARVGKGRLLVCSLGLSQKQESPVARQMLASLLRYASQNVVPVSSLSHEDIDLVFNPKPEAKPVDDATDFGKFFNTEHQK